MAIKIVCDECSDELDILNPSAVESEIANANWKTRDNGTHICESCLSDQAEDEEEEDEDDK